MCARRRGPPSDIGGNDREGGGTFFPLFLRCFYDFPTHAQLSPDVGKLIIDMKKKTFKKMAGWRRRMPPGPEPMG